MEYAAKNGAYSKMYLYMDQWGYPILISPMKIYLFKETVSIFYIPVKHLILFCLYNQFKIEQHLGILLRITRVLGRQTELSYAKTLGIDVSTYRLLESQIITRINKSKSWEKSLSIYNSKYTRNFKYSIIRNDNKFGALS